MNQPTPDPPSPFATRFRQRAGDARLGRVTAVYGSTAFVALQVVELFGNQFLLPDWLFRATLVLLIVCFPIALVVAVAQIPARTDSPAAAAGAGAAGATRAPSRRTADPVQRRRGWRGALSGGVIALACLVFVLGGYVGLRALGVGPIGSLVAAGVLDRRDAIFVAPFEGADAALAGVVTEAFRIDLAQSPVVHVLPDERVHFVLARMQRPADAPIDGATAREIALREGVKAFVRGEVGMAGRGFLLTAALVATADGTSLAAVRETAADSSALIAAIDRLSKRLRERMGESLRDLRGAERLEAVTTTSLEALRHYTQGVHAYDIEGDYGKATTLLQEAVRADSTFAMAWRKLGIAFLGRGEMAQAVDAFTRAHALADRLSAVERYHAIASYHSHVTGDNAAAIAAYRALLAVQPDDGAALNNLATRYIQIGELEQAAGLLERALRVDSTGYQRFSNLASLQQSLGRLDDADRTLDAMARLFPGNPEVLHSRYQTATARFDFVAAESALVGLEGLTTLDPFLRATVAARRGGIHAMHGRYRQARRLVAEAIATTPAEQRAVVQTSALLQEQAVLVYHGVARLDADAIERELASPGLLAQPVWTRPYLLAAQTAAVGGRPDLARRYLERWEREAPEPALRATVTFRDMIRAITARVEGRSADAIEVLTRIAPLLCDICLSPELGYAWEAAGRPDSAIVEYTRYLDSSLNGRHELDVYHLGPVLERAAALLELSGDRAAALRRYGRLIELWADADPELRPRVDAARERVRLLRQG